MSLNLPKDLYSVTSLCSLPSLLICTVVSQVTVLPSYNSKATVSLQIVHQVALLPSYNSETTAYSNFIPIYPNLFEFIVNLFEFLSRKRGCGNA